MAVKCLECQAKIDITPASMIVDNTDECATVPTQEGLTPQVRKELPTRCQIKGCAGGCEAMKYLCQINTDETAT